jgi:UDP-3-O-[3-hydroxymyristoyl] glucosamine N-acyltransferase
MQATLAELAALVGGRVGGDAALVIHGVATLADAEAGQITLLDSIEREPLLAASRAAAAVVPAALAPSGLSVIQVADVHAAFSQIVKYFRPPRRRSRQGVSPAAYISPTARMDADVEVHPGAYIGDDVQIGQGSTIHSGAKLLAGCRIGQQVTIYPNAVLYEDTVVGDGVTIHAAAVLGADGFGYKLVDGRHQLCAQLGWVEIGPHVEIGAGTTIDRGTYGPTVIGEGTKIDDQVMIGHNCRIGRHNILCSQVGIAGSTTTGDYVVVAGQVGIRDHVHIGSRATLGAKAGIIADIPEGASVVGQPAQPVREHKVMLVHMMRLPEMKKELKALAQTVEELKRRLERWQDKAA